MIVGYSYLIWDTVKWFQLLETPTTQQASLITILVGVSAAVFGLYTNSGSKA